MWMALRELLGELFAGMSMRGRFWLAIVLILALLAVFVTITVTGVDATPLWVLLGG
jgi:hypothetical protein